MSIYEDVVRIVAELKVLQHRLELLNVQPYGMAQGVKCLQEAQEQLGYAQTNLRDMELKALENPLN